MPGSCVYMFCLFVVVRVLGIQCLALVCTCFVCLLLYVCWDLVCCVEINGGGGGGRGSFSSFCNFFAIHMFSIIMCVCE